MRAADLVLPRETTNWDTASPLWEEFTGRAAWPISEGAGERLAGHRVLITGAGGSIGSALARAVAGFRPSSLLLLDRSEAGLAQLQADLPRSDPALDQRFALGDIGDRQLVRELLEEQGTEIVFHAAACKYVPLLEANPMAAVITNVLGTQCLLQAAQRAEVDQFVSVSTDKAVDPVSVLGVTKRIAELLVLSFAGPSSATSVLRLGNVLGSNGSVGPQFLRQIERGGPIRITHPEATRYFVSVKEAVHHLIRLLEVQAGPALFVPRMGEPRHVEELARFLLRRSACGSQAIALEYTGLRPGDKLREALFAANECGAPARLGGLLQAIGPVPAGDRLQAELARLADGVERRDVRQLIDGMRAIVPEYRASEAVFVERHTRKGAGACP